MEPVTAAVGLGLVVSLLLAEIVGLTAGGMIVPGYVALSLERPLSLVLTLAAALATVFVVRGISQAAIVYGKRRTALMILVGFLMGAAVQAAVSFTGAGHAVGADPESLAVIGFIIPGLIAIWIDRQGFIETVAVVLIAGVVVRLALIVTGMETIA